MKCLFYVAVSRNTCNNTGGSRLHSSKSEQTHTLLHSVKVGNSSWVKECVCVGVGGGCGGRSLGKSIKVWSASMHTSYLSWAHGPGRGEKICHVEKCQISVHETCGGS